jgi:hypothetical protein
MGYTEYRDEMSGVSLFVPEDWVVTGVVEGQYAIFQSYPEDNYVGGEIFQAGDTKCDLNIRPEGITVEELLGNWQSDSTTTILSQEEVTLPSGLTGIRVQLEGMGSSLAMVGEINDRTIVLICFGEFEPFDTIMETIRPLSD